jgi:hypothetical protein
MTAGFGRLQLGRGKRRDGGRGRETSLNSVERIFPFCI